MKYCPNCQTLLAEGERCPFCGNGRLREAAKEDPVLLITASDGRAASIGALLKEQQIPFESRICGPEGIASAGSGEAGQPANKNIFIPYDRLEECTSLLRHAGLAEAKQEFKPMHPRIRAFWKAFSIVLLLILFTAVVLGADAVIAWISQLFR